MSRSHYSIVMTEVSEADLPAFLELWEESAAAMSQQPGFADTRMFRAKVPDAAFALVNVSEWDTEDEWIEAMKVCAMKAQTFAKVTYSTYEEIRRVSRSES